jgi:hypothetical protein
MSRLPSFRFNKNRNKGMDFIHCYAEGKYNFSLMN